MFPHPHLSISAFQIKALTWGVTRFIWVKYQILKICNEITAAGVEQAWTELPEDLDKMYTAILQTIRDRHESTRRYDMAESALKLILYTVRPLSPEELLEAIAVGSTAPSHRINLPILFDICQNLVVVDEELGVLRFAHFSVQEFLFKKFKPSDGHTAVANVCLGTLMNQGATGRGQEPVMRGYAVDHWPEHVRQSDGASSITALCLDFLGSEAFNSWVSTACESNWLFKVRGPGSISTLIVASYYQLAEIFRNLLYTETDLGATNDSGHTALHLAAMNGNQDIVRLLIARGGGGLGSQVLEWALGSASHVAGDRRGGCEQSGRIRENPTLLGRGERAFPCAAGPSQGDWAGCECSR